MLSDILVPIRRNSFEEFKNQMNSVQFPTPPDSAISLDFQSNSTTSTTSTTSNSSSSTLLINQYLNNHHLISQSPHQQQQQNSIEFPSTSTSTLKRKADVLSSISTNPIIPTSKLQPILAMQRWLIRTYEPDQNSLVSEIEIRVKFKSLSDRFNPSRSLHLDPEPIDLIKEIFPNVTQEIRLIQGSIRSNEEQLIRGLRYKKKSTSTSLAQLDLNHSIPTELHSSQLIEALRERVNELEDELEFETEINKRARLMSNMRGESDEMIRQPGSSHLTLETQSDHSTNATSIHSIDTSSMSLTERIWNRLKIECRAKNVRFEEGKKVTISWYDEIPEADFNAILPFQSSTKSSRKPHSIRIINLTHQQVHEEFFKEIKVEDQASLIGHHWSYLKNKGKNIYLLKKNFKPIGLKNVQVEEGVITYSNLNSQATFNFSVGLKVNL
ncbi:hypothetical protein DFH28DRAFT_556686 [Melampsora americana]|nr:hypothetical protein DFH28DRAFT_556686 [Melampsora americana]